MILTGITASVTYIAGCTDATYSSSKCAHKAGYPDQQWVALARCDGDDIDLFSGCGHHKDEIVIKHEDCTCDAASALISNPASGQPTLNQIGLLPTTAGGTISFNPTALPTATGSSDSSSGGLTTGAKAGIGVGVGVGVPAGSATARATATTTPTTANGTPSPGGSHTDDAAAFPPPVYSTDTQNAQYGWLHPKPELHGDPAHKVELPGDTHTEGNTSVNRMDSIQKTPYESYPPNDYDADAGHHESEAPPLPFVSPRSTGNTAVPQAAGGHQWTGSSNINPITEYRFDDRRY
ncbi:hypothetical protein RRF57_007791 [Xylaria bambusicola]|uniref:Uncharacterized protein n=1 Tax=Xylaria bambusicola TaxID=326684 RepID=A0AAN7Z7R9_9PEZI